MNRWRAPSCSPLPSFRSDLCGTFGRFSRRGQNLACLSSSLLIAVRWLMSADEMKSVILFLISEVKFWFSINPLSKGQRSVWESKLLPRDWNRTSLWDASWKCSSVPEIIRLHYYYYYYSVTYYETRSPVRFCSRASGPCVLFSCERLTLLSRIRIRIHPAPVPALPEPLMILRFGASCVNCVQMVLLYFSQSVKRVEGFFIVRLCRKLTAAVTVERCYTHLLHL